MRKILPVFLGALLIALAAIATPSKAKDTPSPAGHWEGAIELPGTKLGIRVDLEEKEGAWQGTIDIPVQGLRGFKLGGLRVEDGTVNFTMPNIAGDPAFESQLGDDGKTLTGHFTQSGKVFPFKLQRKAKAEKEGATPSQGIPGEGLEGFWQGSLKISAFELRLLFKLKESGEEISGTLDSIDQNVKDIPVSKATLSDQNVQIEVKSTGGTFAGVLSDDGAEIKGQWKQGGQDFPLVLKRLAREPDLRRPQEPQPPYPYEEEDVTFRNAAAEIELAGTFTYPKSPGPHPAVALISGSGPQDRDEAIMGHRPFFVLADHLTRQGIAVLRYDDRGVGKSKGSFSQANVSDFTTDALAAVEFLKSRPEVDRKYIGLIGHSEGGVIAPKAAAQNEGIAFIVLMAGVGVPMEELLARQVEDLLRVAGGDEETIAKQVEAQRKIFSIVRSQDDAEKARQEIEALIEGLLEEFTAEELEAMGHSSGQAAQQVELVLSPWFRELLEVNPRPTLEKVTCPVLAINGEKDIQVASQENLEAIAEALKAGGNGDVTTVEFPSLNHLFQQSQTGALSEYGIIEETINPRVLTTISDWIRKRTGLE